MEFLHAQEFFAMEMISVSQRNVSIIFAQSPPLILTHAHKMLRLRVGSATECSVIAMQTFSVKMGSVLNKQKKLGTAMTVSSGSFCSLA